MATTGPTTKDTSTIALGLAQIRVGNSAANIASIGSVLTSAASIGALGSTKFTGTVDYWKLTSGFPQLEDMTIPIKETAMLEVSFKEITPYNLALARGIDPGAGAAQPATVTFVDSKTTAGTTTGNIAVTDTAGPVNDTFTVVFQSATTAKVYGTDKGLVGSMANLTNAFAPDNGGNPYFSIPANFFSGTWAADDTYTFRTTAYVAAGGSYSDNHSGSIGLGSMTAPAFVRMEAVYTYPNGVNHMYIIFPRANATTSMELDLQAEDAAAAPLTFEAKRSDSETAGGNAVWDLMSLGRIFFD
jgi:hypothetical protein